MRTQPEKKYRELGFQAHVKLRELFYKKLLTVFPEERFPQMARKLSDIQLWNDWQTFED